MLSSTEGSILEQMMRVKEVKKAGSLSRISGGFCTSNGWITDIGVTYS